MFGSYFCLAAGYGCWMCGSTMVSDTVWIFHLIDVELPVKEARCSADHLRRPNPDIPEVSPDAV